MGFDENIHYENDLDKLSRNNPFLKDIILSVEDNLQNEQFGVEDLAQAIRINRYQIYRRLKKLTGKTISQFIREIRLIKAMELLQK